MNEMQGLFRIAVLPGDGIGPEVTAEAVKVLERLRREGKEEVRAAMWASVVGGG